MKDEKKKSWMNALFAYAEGEKKRMYLSVVLSMLSVAAGLAPFYCMYAMLCLFVAGTATAAGIAKWCLLALLAYAVKILLFSLSTGVSHAMAYTILESLRLRLADRFLHAPLGDVENHSIGEIKSMMVDKIENLEPPLAHMIPEGAGHIVLPIVSILALLCLDWRLALASLVTFPLSFLCMGLTFKISGESFSKYPSNWKDSYYFTFEGLGGYIANADKIAGKPLKAEAKAYVADKLAALQQELYKDFVTTDQLAKATDARALATENGKAMAEKAHKLGVELVEYITKNEALQPSVFTDVKEGAYYADAVNWAVDKKVTSGKTETTFAPNDSCTRAQAVTFLWRAAGSPEPTATTMTFTDVKADSYYYKAVLWAVENKITSGMSDTLFAPDAVCSRSQIVTFLYRMQNSPESKAENPFTDVKADAYYANAVLWAVENGVTTGASATTFDPAGDCTRGQIVTFLYRCLNK